MDTKCVCGHPKEGVGREPGHYFGDQTMKTPCNYPSCRCPQYTPPPSREPGQADAELEADIAVFRTEMEHWNNPPRTAALTVRVIADRTQREERIGELENHIVKLQDTLSEYMLTMAKPAEGFKNEEEYVGWQRAVNHWEREARALLEEVPDGE